MTWLKPIITEKTMRLAKAGQFSFAVDGELTKPQLERKISDWFKVEVTRVNVINLPAKSRRTGSRRLSSGQSRRFKAIVTLKPGQTIEYFEAEKKETKKKAPAVKAKGGK